MKDTEMIMLKSARPSMATVDVTTVDTLTKSTLARLGRLVDGFEWVEQEIEQAGERYPQEADRLWHLGLPLFTPTHECMDYDLVYRSHCRELIDRALAGEDTRPGTAVEVACSMRDVSAAMPLKSSGAALYMRVWRLAGLPYIPELAAAGYHYEELNGDSVAADERAAREFLAASDRTPPVDIACDGRHLGVPAPCRYVRATQLTMQY
ncbi:hypothetical protein AB0A63_31215 [Lentzea sp. NPDC042327]|uniref:hypothetical protein n=1 Tax=Lentzea sp. NPDC042327 TaxID=3154801 RepID=UPI0034080254